MGTLLDEVRESLALPRPGMAREIRQAAGVSQARLAAELGVAELTVARWETGTRTPRGDMRRQYGRVLTELDRLTHSAGEGGPRRVNAQSRLSGPAPEAVSP
jgi:transcriptional regulator with XRE-family HTH domain